MAQTVHVTKDPVVLEGYQAIMKPSKFGYSLGALVDDHLIELLEADRTETLKWAESKLKNPKRSVLKPEPWEEVSEGKYKVKFNWNDETRPPVVDSEGTPITDESTPLYSGSKVKLAFRQKPYVLKDGVTYGTSLKLVGIQVIALFSHDDEEMITCKYGNWWETNEQRGRANNSAVLLRGSVGEEEFKALWKRIEASGSGEPGIYWTNDLDWGTNPCCEIALRPYQFCNLCEVNVSDVENQLDLNDRVSVAAFFGTLQAGFTDFHYLRPIWQKTTQKDALLGIGMTGIGSGEILKYNLELAANTAKVVNSMISEKIGTNEAARITCIKPSGTTSLVLGTASGIHAWHAPYYLRTMRFGKKKFSDVLEEIYNNQKKKDQQVTALINELKPLGPVTLNTSNSVGLKFSLFILNTLLTFFIE